MYKIINKQIITGSIKRVYIEAVHVASRFRPGQFLVVTADKYSLRLLMTPIEVDAARGTVSFIFKETNRSLQALGAMKIGDEVYSVAGPFGQEFRPEKIGTVLCVAHNEWAAHLYFVAKALKDAGNKVIGLMDFADKKEVILESKMRRECQQLVIVTKDSNVYKKQESIFEQLPKIVLSGSISAVFACGPLDFLMSTKRSLTDSSILHILLPQVLLADQNIFDTTEFQIQKNTVYPCFSQTIYQADDIDLVQLMKDRSAGEEYQWQSSRSMQGRPSSALEIFPRLLSGLLKNKL